MPQPTNPIQDRYTPLSGAYEGFQQCPKCMKHSSFDELLRADRMGSDQRPAGYAAHELKGMGLSANDRVCRYCGTLIVKFEDDVSNG
jgi:hypothetical protein